MTKKFIKSAFGLLSEIFVVLNFVLTGSAQPQTSLRKDHLRVTVRLPLVLLSVFLSAPAGILGNWGLEVGRADTGDVLNLNRDWITYRRVRASLDEMGENVVGIGRQKQLLGVARDIADEQLYLEAQEYFLAKLVGPLQRIALNPAASCAEARFALAEMLGARRQQQMLGLEESESINSAYFAIEQMANARCRDEALDECVATGRFMQILDLMTGMRRQMQMLGGEGDEERWAEDALTQCAIYELHFVSKTKGDNSPAAASIEIVRDGKIQIRFKTPPGGLMSARVSLGEVLKGQTAGGNNPFLVSVQCTGRPPFELICSPGANSTSVEVRINDLDLRHREFYIAYEKDKYTLREAPFPRERLAGEDKFSFEFEGGEFSIQGLLKSPFNISRTMPFGDVFYMAHQKDRVGDRRLVVVKSENIKSGVYPVILQFTYADRQTVSGAIMSDSTEFELIHKPEPKPFEKVPEPIRKPLKPPPDK